jgi:predicted porin
MCKWLVALAVAGAALMSPAAQAQTSAVTLYGSLNVDIETVRGTQLDGSNPTVSRLSSNSSRFGVRGTEYLGAGLSAIFQLESSVFADTNGGTIAGRETYAGLRGSWGTVKIGNFLTPYDDIHPIFGNTPTLATSILSTAAIWAQGTLTKGAGGFDARLGNSIRYDTPVIGGFNGEFQYSARDASGTTGSDNGDHASELRHANVLSAGVFYGNGPIDLGVAYERNSEVLAAGQNDQAFSVTGAYDFGTIIGGLGLRLGGVYEPLKYATPTGDLKRDFFGISATVPAGGGVIYAFWGRASDGKGDAVDGTVVGGLVKGADTGSDQWELSYSYALSQRTLLYVGYVKLMNDANARYTFNINPYPTAAGGKPGGAVLGFAHFF